MLQKVEFGPEAIVYIREQLSWGRALGKLLLNLPLEEGRVIAYLPASTSFEQRRNFRTGGLPKTQSKTVDNLRGLISKYLVGPGKKYAVFEDINAQVGDPFLQEEKEQYFIYKTDIYYFLNSKNNDPERMRCIVTGYAWYFLGMLTSLAEDGPDIQNHQIVTHKLLKQLTMSAEYLVVGAYDAENELIWCRKGLLDL